MTFVKRIRCARKIDSVVKGLIATVTLATASTSFAQDTSNEYVERTWTGGLGLTYFALDTAAAESQKIGDTAYSLDFFANYNISSQLVATLGLGLARLDDKAEFSQQVLVTSLFDTEVETVSSDAKGIHLYTELQYVLPPFTPLDLQFRGGAGYGVIGYTDRSIDDCSDCREEDIDLKGGAYVTAGIFREVWSEQFKFGLNLRQYVSSDIKSSAILWFEYIQ